jgi:deazaflavin-dependent oxidoreductase (nitroreductase family)
MTATDPMHTAMWEHIANHKRRYLETDGEDGHIVDGMDGWNLPTLLLTTVGWRTRLERTTPLMYNRDGDDYLVVASRAGYDKPPRWFTNLTHEPRVKVQVKADRFDAVARAAGPEEKPRLWRIMADMYPVYDEYQAVTDREIPVVVLTRIKGSG